MKSILYLIVVTSFLLLGCQSVEVNNYVHSETEEARKALQWSTPKYSSFDPSTIPQNGVLLIPDFYQFWPEYSAMAYIYFAANENVDIELVEVVVRSPDTEELKGYEIRQLPEPRKIESGAWIYKIRAIDDETSSSFLNSEQLKLEILWKVNGVEKQSTFDLERVSRTDIAWPT